MRKLLILDCDGVLYPASNISHNDFVFAFNKTQEYYKDKNFKIEESDLKSAAQFWNAIYKKCLEKECAFDEFCKQMIANINYKKIRKSVVLLSLLKATRKKFDIAVLSDNHHYHLEQILKHRFNLGINDFKSIGIDCYDITSTEKDGKFFPKCDEKALKNFIKKQGRDISDCIFIDNSHANIMAGKKIGMTSIYIYRKRSLQKCLRDLNSKKFI